MTNEDRALIEEHNLAKVKKEIAAERAVEARQLQADRIVIWGSLPCFAFLILAVVWMAQPEPPLPPEPGPELNARGEIAQVFTRGYQPGLLITPPDPHKRERDARYTDSKYRGHYIGSYAQRNDLKKQAKQILVRQEIKRAIIELEISRLRRRGR